MFVWQAAKEWKIFSDKVSLRALKLQNEAPLCGVGLYVQCSDKSRGVRQLAM